MKPKNCPNCKAFGDQIDNLDYMRDALGLDKSDGDGKQWMCQKCGHLFDDEDVDYSFNEDDIKKMTLGEIVALIYDDWRDMSVYARPYVDAMSQIDNINDPYGNYENGIGIVTYFLLNAKMWKGNVARIVKKHLNDLIKNKKNKNNLCLF